MSHHTENMLSSTPTTRAAAGRHTSSSGRVRATCTGIATKTARWTILSAITSKAAPGFGRREGLPKGLPAQLARSWIKDGDDRAIPHPCDRRRGCPRLGDERVKAGGVRHSVGVEDEHR